jgi:hypothetical protein
VIFIAGMFDIFDAFAESRLFMKALSSYFHNVYTTKQPIASRLDLPTSIL